MRTVILGLLLASMLFSGCVIFGEQNVTNNTTAPPPPPPPPKLPAFTIASPGSGEVMVVPGDTADVSLVLTTQNLILKPAGGAKKAGEGHFSVTVDANPPETVSTKNYLISGLGAGEHTIKVELMNNDRTPYSGVQPKEVTFTIEKEKPKEYVPQTHTVVINDFSYSPPSITIKRTDSITFENKGAFPRDATCFVANVQKFDTKVLQPGASATIKFEETFECEFYSSLHRAMTGTLKIEPNDYDMANQ